MNKESHENQFNIKLQSLFFQERNGPSSLRGRLKMGEDHRYQVRSDYIENRMVTDIRCYQISHFIMYQMISNIIMYQIIKTQVRSNDVKYQKIKYRVISDDQTIHICNTNTR